LLSYYFEHIANLEANPRFIWNEESEKGREHIQASVEAMLEHLKVYADRYLGYRSYQVGQVRELISSSGARSWERKKWLEEAFAKVL